MALTPMELDDGWEQVEVTATTSAGGVLYLEHEENYFISAPYVPQLVNGDTVICFITHNINREPATALGVICKNGSNLSNVANTSLKVRYLRRKVTNTWAN